MRRAPQRAGAASLLLGIGLLALGVAGCGERGAGDAGDTASNGSPAVLGDAPDFTLTDQRGAGFGKSDLAGRLWIADFVFTRCTSMCPRLTARMAELQEELRADPVWQELRLVSFSVDPEYDRPQVLAEYADRNRADPERWVFLTGGREEIWALSKEGFKLAVGEDPGNADEPLFHSGKFVLVDRDGRIRGYYDALDAEGYGALVADLRHLAEESGGAGANPSSWPRSGPGPRRPGRSSCRRRRKTRPGSPPGPRPSARPPAPGRCSTTSVSATSGRPAASASATESSRTPGRPTSRSTTTTGPAWPSPTSTATAATTSTSRRCRSARCSPCTRTRPSRRTGTATSSSSVAGNSPRSDLRQLSPARGAIATVKQLVIDSCTSTRCPRRSRRTATGVCSGPVADPLGLRDPGAARRYAVVTLRRRRCVALAALAATAACAGADEPRDAAVAARDSRFVISYVASAPASREASGRLRIRVELQDSWHVAPDVPATLKLEGSPGLELEPAEQRAEDAVQRSPDALEFASAFRTASAGEALVRGRIKFGICEGEDERCVIVRRELELPLEIAFRD